MRKAEEIRTALFNDTYFPIRDGVVMTVHSYASIMNRISEAVVVCPDQKGRFDDRSLPYEVIRSASIKLPVMNYAIALPIDPVCVRKIVKRGRIDLVHVHSPFMLGNTALSAAKALKIPSVATFHSKYYDDILQVTKSRALARLVTDRIVSFYNRCDSVWACSESTAETLRSYGYKKKITVMPNGTDLTEPENIADLKERARVVCGLTPDRKTLLFVGSLIWQKNLKLVLDAYRLLCRKEPGAYRLLIVGSGNHGKEVRAYAEKLAFAPGQILFTGSITDRELLCGIFAAADLFFFPSVYDNAPLVLREAAVMGTPALLTEGANAAEVIVPDVNGFTAAESAAAMAAKLFQVLHDDELRRRVGERAKETIPVPWEQIVPKVYEQYALILDRRGRN